MPTSSAAPVRLFATFLSSAALVVPAAFLLNPAIAPLLAPPDTDRSAIEGVTFETMPPVVVVVFDQLPLASLSTATASSTGRLRYPHFAALADEATWFRNASAVSPTTSRALPAILTGRYPERGRLPTVDDHPRQSLHAVRVALPCLDVIEPLTSLCPAVLCPVERPGVLAWLGSIVLRDLRIVWLQTVLPDDLTRSLPPVTQTWADFAVAEPPSVPGQLARAPAGRSPPQRGKVCRAARRQRRVVQPAGPPLPARAAAPRAVDVPADRPVFLSVRPRIPGLIGG